MKAFTVEKVSRKIRNCRLFKQILPLIKIKSWRIKLTYVNTNSLIKVYFFKN